MPTELEELVGFIANPNPQIRLLATENLVPYSTSQPSIFKVDNLTPIKNLKLLVKDHPKIAEHVITILINLSADREVLESLATDDKFLETILSFIVVGGPVAHILQNLPILIASQSPSEPNANLLSMLLANLAKWDGLKSLLDKRQPAPKELGSDDRVLNQLLDLFVKGAEGTYNKAADFDHLSYLFADLTKHDEIRYHFIRKQDYDEVIPITKLIVFTEHKSDVRRKGVASTIKNVAFDVPSHPSFMSDDEINMLPYILLPIIGSEEYDLEESMAMLPELQLLPPDKQRDSDPNIIQTHVETLLLLCTTRAGRDRLREINVYPLIRETHSRVNDADVKDACERLVNFLKGDEEDTNDNAQVEEHGREAAKNAIAAADDDDEDDEIVEV